MSSNSEWLKAYEAQKVKPAAKSNFSIKTEVVQDQEDFTADIKPKIEVQEYIQKEFKIEADVKPKKEYSDVKPKIERSDDNEEISNGMEVISSMNIPHSMMSHI